MKDDNLGWTIQQETATFRSSDHEFRLRLDTPQSGIDDWRYLGHDLAVSPFHLTLPASGADHHKVEEAYIRGYELVVDYGLGLRDRVRPQIVWRVVRQAVRLTLDVTIGVQTPYLASNPSVQCETEFRASVQPVCLANTVKGLAGGSRSTIRPPYLFRLQGSDLSYVQMVCPQDLEPPGASWQGTRLSYRVMCEALEKGVIRKVRMRGMVIPRVNDESVVRDAFVAFEMEAPPLTT